MGARFFLKNKNNSGFLGLKLLPYTKWESELKHSANILDCFTYGSSAVLITFSQQNKVSQYKVKKIVHGNSVKDMQDSKLGIF